MEDKKQLTAEKDKPKRHFMHFILDADQKNNQMPSNAADSILKRILSFFHSHKDNKKEK